MSVGLLAVRLLYRLYVCVHLSKWFTFFLFMSVVSLLLCRFTLAGNGLGIAEGGEFYHKSSIEERMLNLAQMPNRSRSAPLLAIPCYGLLFFCQPL